MLRFALEIAHYAWFRREPEKANEALVALVREADAAGLDSLWLNEDPGGWDAYAMLGALSLETSAIRLGPGVVSPLNRSPLQIRASASTLARLAPGRSFVGIGRGQSEWHPNASSEVRADPLGAVERTILLVRETFAIESDRPPIYLAASGPRALDLAGRMADGVRFNELATIDYLRSAIARVRESAVTAGRDAAVLRFFVHPGIVITDDPDPVLERKKRWIAVLHSLPGMEVHLQTPGIDHAGIMKAVRRAMRTNDVLARGGGFENLRREGNIDAAVAEIPRELVDAAAIVGPIEHVTGRLKALVAAGATDCFLNLDEMPQRGSALTALLAELHHGTD